MSHWPSGFFCACVILNSAVGGAQEQPADARRLSELSIEDLMKVDVITASRAEEKLARATSVKARPASTSR